MSKPFLHYQQNNTQADTIVNSDTSLTNTKHQANFHNQVLNFKDTTQEKSLLITKIKNNFDATSYIYTVSGKPVELTNCFINNLYFQNKAKIEHNTEVNTKSTFSNHENGVFKISETDYLLLILVLLSALLAFVKLNGKSYFQRKISSIQSFTFSNFLFKERNKLFQLNDLLSLFVFHVSFGILLVNLFEYFNFPIVNYNKAFVYFVFIVLNFIFIYLYKVFILISGKYFSISKNVSEYLFYTNSNLIILGVLNIFFLFGILFAPQNNVNLFIYSILFIYGLSYFARGLKIFSVFLTNRFPLFYMILYFCALEIVPLFILARIITDAYHDKIDIF